MIYFPNAKINIGLFVTDRREDGFHNIESLFYPIGLNDALEMRLSEDGITGRNVSGEGIEKDVSDTDNNTVLKAFRMLKTDFPQIKDVNIYLDKGIPVFAGLGGGSSDATYALLLTDYMFNLQLDEDKLLFYASLIGSDCPFFVKNVPQFVYSRGDKMTSVDLSLTGFYLVLIKPPLNISTQEAYKDVHKTSSPFDLRKLKVNDIANWRCYVKNDFEVHLFEKYPLLREIKDSLYDTGALYAQMSGSGSTVYGIFEHKVDLNALNLSDDTFVWQERLER